MRDAQSSSNDVSLSIHLPSRDHQEIIKSTRERKENESGARLFLFAPTSRTVPDRGRERAQSAERGDSNFSKEKKVKASADIAIR